MTWFTTVAICAAAIGLVTLHNAALDSQFGQPPRADRSGSDVIGIENAPRLDRPLIGLRHAEQATPDQRSQAPIAPSVEALLSNSFEPSVEEEMVQCVGYSGPCFFMNHPAGDAPTHAVPSARLHAIGMVCSCAR